MKLEHFGMAEPGDCRVVFTASAQELEEAIAAEQAGENPPADEEDLMAAAVNRAILTGFSPLYAELVENRKLLPVTDPDFELLAVNRAEGFRAGAQFFCVPPLELGRYTGFVQPIQPRPLRELTIELEINRFHEQGKMLAERELVAQLGNEVKGPLPKQLVAGNYFAEQRQFNLRMQANNINFDQYLKVQGQTVEEFRQQLHADAERKLRSRLGLLLVAGKEHLWPTEAEVATALAAWDVKKQGEKTFPANDARKLRQGMAANRAAKFVVEHSTLTPPPAEPVVEELPR